MTEKQYKWLDPLFQFGVGVVFGAVIALILLGVYAVADLVF